MDAKITSRLGVRQVHSLSSEATGGKWIGGKAKGQKLEEIEPRLPDPHLV